MADFRPKFYRDFATTTPLFDSDQQNDTEDLESKIDQITL
jgi:hypothetical protein